MAKYQQFMSSFTTIIRGTLVANVQLKFYILFPLLLDIISQIERASFTTMPDCHRIKVVIEQTVKRAFSRTP